MRDLPAKARALAMKMVAIGAAWMHLKASSYTRGSPKLKTQGISGCVSAVSTLSSVVLTRPTCSEQQKYTSCPKRPATCST
eukprot:9190143-Pyramimonas_sp.AAC.1